MSGIEIVSHTTGNIIVSESRIPAPSLSEPPPLEPTIWATIVIFYTEKARLAISGLGHGPYLVNPSFFFPFKGLFYIATKPIYWKYLILLTICFLIIFSIIATSLYMLLLPLLTLGVITVGPMGLVILHVQWILLSNQFTVFVTKHIISPNLKEHIFRITIEMVDKSKLFDLRQKHEFKPLPKMKYDPTFQVYIRTTEMIRAFLWKLILVLTSLIPIVGPILANQLSSVKRSYSLIHYYLYNMKNMNREQALQYKYKHLISFIYMGMSAGILEMLPIFSVFTVIGNVVGGALWSIEQLALIDKLRTEGS